jgi:hypothetical protein
MTPERHAEHDDLKGWRDALRALSAPVPGGCPTDEELAALVLDDLEPSLRRERADHVVACAACRERWEILSTLHLEAQSLQSGRARRPWRHAAAAAAAALAVGTISAYLMTGTAGPAPGGSALRGAAPEAAVRPIPDSVLAAPPRELAWPPPRAGVEARVRLLDARGEVLWETHSSDGRVRLPDRLRDRLRSGRAYFWVVDQESSGRLGPFWFTLE